LVINVDFIVQHAAASRIQRFGTAEEGKVNQRRTADSDEASRWVERYRIPRASIKFVVSYGYSVAYATEAVLLPPKEVCGSSARWRPGIARVCREDRSRKRFDANSLRRFGPTRARQLSK
jgi:hypothetical protein